MTPGSEGGNPVTITRRARGGVLVVGGGFGGVTVGRLLGQDGATIVNPQNSMLFTPMIPEVAAGVVEVRNVMTPLAMACPHVEVIEGRVTDLALDDNRAEVKTDGGLHMSITYDHVVVAVGAVPRTLPVPGLIEHAVGCTSVLDALYLRNQVLRLLAAAAVDPDPERRRRHLTFVFVGGGYAGVETLSELRDLAHDALRCYPALVDVPQRWVLVDAAPKILAEIPSRLGHYVYDLLLQRGVDVRLSTRLQKVVDGRITLSDGTELDTGLLVWTAGVKADPVVARFGLPLDDRGRARLGPMLQAEGRQNIWSLGDCAAVPNAANAGQVDPPTSQHALRQGKQLVKNLQAFRAAGHWGVTVSGLSARSPPWAERRDRRHQGHTVTGSSRLARPRGVHLVQVPGASRRLGVVSDWALGLVFLPNMVTYSGFIVAPSIENNAARPVAQALRLPAPGSTEE